jgi:dynein-related subfamily AAA family protein
MTTAQRLVETVTLGQAKSLLRAMAHDQSLLLLSPPGLGKSEAVAQAAADAGLPCRSLLGTQIAPEDVSGIPRIVGERSVFCPPRVLLPESPEPFCLFLDELPACAPDVQKSFYSLLLERRLGEHALPKGTWVVAAGNRVEDRALVRGMSSALVNRVVILNIRSDLKEWLGWAATHGVRSEILAFMVFMPAALLRTVPTEPRPFSTPRAWASLSRALDLADAAGILDASIRRALAFGRISPEDAAVFCVMAENRIDELRPVIDYVNVTSLLPADDAARWFVLSRVREAAATGALDDIAPAQIRAFLMALPREHRFALLVGAVEVWGRLGADDALRESLREVTGL